MTTDPPALRRRALALAAAAAGGALLVVSLTATGGSSSPADEVTLTATRPPAVPAPSATALRATAVTPGILATSTTPRAPRTSNAVATTAGPAPTSPTSTIVSTTVRPVASSATTPVAPSSIRLGDAVEAPVVPVGVLPDGELLLPDDPTVTGWWSGGAAAGSNAGSVVIAGHVDSYRYGIGTFAVLHDLQPGDSVVLGDAAGRSHAYRVVSRQQVPKPALPAELFAVDGPARLVLITCGGSFDESSRHYRDNLIVVAEPT